jgi:hypothetical protein
MTTFELAQVNISRLLAPLDSPQLKDFVDALDEVNAVADAAPGFRWRLQSEAGDATAIRVFDDDWLIVNMSVWESQETLLAYVYGDAHRTVLRGRRQWFHPPGRGDDRAVVGVRRPSAVRVRGRGTLGAPAFSWSFVLRVHAEADLRSDVRDQLTAPSFRRHRNI